jgi:hypothetical protein
VTNRSAATQALPIKVLELILWLLLGSVFKARLEHLAEACWRKILFSKFTLGMSRKITKKKCLHRERCVRAKAKVKKFRHRALSVALVVRCRCRPSNKPPTRMHQESTSSEPVRWKWKKRKVVWTSSFLDLSLPPLTVFVRLVTTFYACPNYWILSAITIIPK